MGKEITGYKVFNSDWTCRGFKYEIGKEYEEKNIEICSRGFHFCTKPVDCFSYYSFNSENKVAEVVGSGKILTHDNDSKICASNIKIVREIGWNEVLEICNHGKNNTGHRNTGDWNTGGRNTGHRNTGDWNTGGRNTGDSNTGDWNTGDRNTGHSNTGNGNTGHSNTGGRNTGGSNTGHRNTGHRNTGHRNTGHSNTGGRNTGDWNTGDWNTGDSNTGVFNTKEQKIMFFNKQSELTISEWRDSKAYRLLSNNFILTEWVYESAMTDEEKKSYPKFYVQQGYLKKYEFKDACMNMWAKLSGQQKKTVQLIPNFDANVFEEITGIKV